MQNRPETVKDGVKRGADGRFLAGTMPGPGRPRGSKPAYPRPCDLVVEHLLSRGRQTRNQRLVQALDDLFAKDPKTYLKVCIALLPRPYRSDGEQKAARITVRDLVGALEERSKAEPPASNRPPDGGEPDEAPPEPSFDG